MHDGAIFTPSPAALAGTDCGWIPPPGAPPSPALNHSVAVVELTRLPSVAVPAACSYHRLAVAATNAGAAALLLGTCACGRGR